MAIAFDAASRNGSSWSTSVSSVTFSHTTSGSNRFLAVGVATYNAGLLRSVSGITYNGVAMTQANTISASLEGNTQSSDLWYLDGPATGANNIVVTLDASTSFAAALSSSYTGKTSSGIDAQATAQNTSSNTNAPACNVNVVASDCWLVGFAYSRAGVAPSAGTGTTSRQDNGVGQGIGDSNGVVGTGNQTLAWTLGAANTWPGVNSLSFSEAGGGGGGGDPEGGLIGGKLIAGGLLIRGVLIQ